MTYISEDPTLLAGGLLVLAGGFVVALKVTQQGKYLIRALIAAGLAAAVVLVEWLWVTDGERIEQVVYGLRDAVANSDVERVLGYMAPDVQYVRDESALDEAATREFIRANLERVRFDLVRVSGLRVNVAEQSRRGTAEFHVLSKGTLDTAAGKVPVGTRADSLWSLGLRETGPHVWKVNRITPMQLPQGALEALGGSRRAAFNR